MAPRPSLASVTVAAALGAALLAPSAAEARTPCANETATPTAQNAALVSDAVVCLTNQIRAHHGLPALRRDARLDTAARRHSQDMEDRGFFGHTNPDGLGPSQRAQLEGYTLGAGENIAAGYRNAVHVVTGWMGSAGHCRNMLSSARDIGVGVTAGQPTYTMNLGDYSGRVPAAPAAGCAYTLDLDALGTLEVAAPAPAPAPQAEAPDAPVPPAFAMTGVRLDRATLKAGRRGLVLATLSTPATVTARLARAVRGRRSGGRCARAARRGPRCSTWRTVGSRLTWPGVAGANRLTLPTKGLARGRYRITISAADATGRAARPRTVNLTLR